MPESDSNLQDRWNYFATAVQAVADLLDGRGGTLCPHLTEAVRLTLAEHLRREIEAADRLILPAALRHQEEGN